MTRRVDPFTAAWLDWAMPEWRWLAAVIEEPPAIVAGRCGGPVTAGLQPLGDEASKGGEPRRAPTLMRGD